MCIRDSNVVMVDAGLSRYAALKEDGSVWVWGADGYGGDGKMIPVSYTHLPK